MKHTDGRIGVVYNDEPYQNGRVIVRWTVKRGIVESGFGEHRTLVNPERLTQIGNVD